MKLLKFAFVCMVGSMISHAVVASDDLEIQSPNFKESYIGLLTPSKNFKVIAGGLVPEIDQYLFSDSYFENRSNHRYIATYHVYAQMNNQQRAAYLLLQHNSYLNDVFFPEKSPLTNSKVSEEQLNLQPLRTKINELRTDHGIFDKIVDKETMLQALRAHYDYYMRDQFNARFYGKDKSTFTYGLDNYSSLNIRSVEGNFRVVDRNTGVLLGDTMVKLNHWLPGNRARELRMITIPSTMPEWDSVKMEDLAIKFQPTAVTTMGGKRIDIYELYMQNTKDFNF